MDPRAGLAASLKDEEAVEKGSRALTPSTVLFPKLKEGQSPGSRAGPSPQHSRPPLPSLPFGAGTPEQKKIMIIICCVILGIVIASTFGGIFG